MAYIWKSLKTASGVTFWFNCCFVFYFSTLAGRNESCYILYHDNLCRYARIISVMNIQKYCRNLARIWPETLGPGRARTRVALISCSKKRTIAKRELIEIPAMTQSEKTHIYDLRLIHDFDGIVLYSPFYYGYYTSFNGHSNFDQSQSEKTGQKSSYQYNLPLGSVS